MDVMRSAGMNMKMHKFKKNQQPAADGAPEMDTAAAGSAATVMS